LKIFESDFDLITKFSYETGIFGVDAIIYEIKTRTS